MEDRIEQVAAAQGYTVAEFTLVRAAKVRAWEISDAAYAGLISFADAKEQLLTWLWSCSTAVEQDIFALELGEFPD